MSGNTSSGSPIDDSSLRQTWKTGKAVQIYSNSRKKWFVGEVAQIFHDSEGEWLEVRYDKSMSKQVQRYSTDIKPTDEQLESLKKEQQKKDAPFAEIEIQERSRWEKNNKVEIFSNTHKEWYLGEIVEIIKDDEGEWLNVVWHRDNGEAMSKQVQRFSTDVRPPAGKNIGSGGEGDGNGGNPARSLSDEIKMRTAGNFKRRAPMFSRTLRASTFSHPATSQYRRAKKLVDIDESQERKRDKESVSKWTASQVQDWIKSLGGEPYDRCARKFKKINGSKLLALTDDQLTNMSFQRIHSLKIALEVQKLNNPSLNIDDDESDAMEEIPMSWDSVQVKQWLIRQVAGLSQYGSMFVSHGIDGVLLFALEMGDLETIGVKSVHRNKMLECIAKLRRENYLEGTPLDDRKEDLSTGASNGSSSHSSSSSSSSSSSPSSEQSPLTVVDLMDDATPSSATNNVAKKRRGSHQISPYDLAEARSTFSVNQPRLTDLDDSILEILDDMSGIITSLSGIFSVPGLREKADQARAKVERLMDERKKEKSRLIAAMANRSMPIGGSSGNDEGGGEGDLRENNNLGDAVIPGAMPGGGAKSKKKQRGLETNDMHLPGLDDADGFIKTVSGHQGHKRRQSLPFNQMQMTLPEGDDEEEDDDLSDMDDS